MWCGRSIYIPLLTERGSEGTGGYKHVAPPEQEPSIPMMTTFCAKLVGGNILRALLCFFVAADGGFEERVNLIEIWRAHDKPLLN